MADQVQPGPVAAGPAPSGKKKPSKPKIRFGEVLDLGGHQYWTVSSTDGGVVVSRRGYPDQLLTDAQVAAAKAHPLPTREKNKGAEWAIRGIQLGVAFDLPPELGGTARIIGFDAISNGGEVQLNIPGKGPVWVPKSAVQDLRLATGDRDKGLSVLRGILGETSTEETDESETKKPKDREKKERIERAVKTATAEAAGTVVDRAVRRDLDLLMMRDPEAAEKKRQAEIRKAVETRESAPVIKAPTPQISEQTVEAPGEFEKTVDIPDIGEEIETTTSTTTSTTSAAIPVAAAPTPAVSVAQTVAVGTAAAAAVAAPAGPAKTVQVSATVPVGAAPEASIRETRLMMKMQSDQARETVAKATPQERIQIIATAQNSLSALQAIQKRPPKDEPRAAFEARGEQIKRLQKAIGIVREMPQDVVVAGNIPTEVVQAIRSATPADMPRVPPERARAMVAAMFVAIPIPSGVSTGPAAAVPVAIAAAPTIRVGAPPVQARHTVSVGGAPTGGAQVAGGIRQQLRPEIANAVAFHAPTTASAPGSGYVEGIGSESAGSLSEDYNPVFESGGASYALDRGPTEDEEAEDLFEPGGASDAGFMERQRQAIATGQQFQPETTGEYPGGELLGPGEKETTRSIPSRGAPQPPPKVAADLAKQQQVAALAQAVKKEEEEQSEETEGRGAKKDNPLRVASVRGTAAGSVAVGVATSETFIGSLLAFGKFLWNSNMRVLAIKMKPGGLFRFFYPAAQFPFEVTGIIAMDILIGMMLFAGFCILVAIAGYMYGLCMEPAIPGMPEFFACLI